MNIIILILTVLLMISTYKPSAIRLNTLKKAADQILVSVESVKKDKTKFSSVCSIAVFFSSIYCIILALYIHTVPFTFVMIFWIVQSIFESNIMSKYVNEGLETKLLNSVAYRIVSKIIDAFIYGYIIYFAIINW